MKDEEFAQRRQDPQRRKELSVVEVMPNLESNIDSVVEQDVLQRCILQNEIVRRKMRHPNPEIVRGAIFDTIQNQIRDNDPPETAETLERLIGQGYTRQEAMNLVGCVVVAEIFDVLKSQRPFNRERFIEALKKLPQLPWD